jgi:putative DNA primase/helicase
MSDDMENVPMDEKVVPFDRKSRIEQRRQEEDEQYPPDKKKGGGPGDLDDRFILSCYHANQLGDGELYCALFKGKFIYNNTKEHWMVWREHYWSKDTMNESIIAVDTVAQQYLGLADKYDALQNSPDNDGKADYAKIIKGLRKRANQLREDRRRTACLKFARTCKNSLAIDGRQFDQDPWLLGCPNGVLDLRTLLFRAGQPDDFISKSTRAVWRGIDTPSPKWDAAVSSILSDRENVAQVHIEKFLYRFFGSALIGEVNERAFLCMTGRGFNGKGFITDMLMEFLGDYAEPIDPNMLLAQRTSKSSSQASPDIIALKGLRVIVASETDDGQRFSTAMVKRLSGGDELIARGLHEKDQLRFKPTHTLLMLTNVVPSAPFEDVAFWGRFHKIPFQWSFVDTPTEDYHKQRDKDLASAVREELSGIFARFVEGCREYQKIGLAPPDIVRQASEDQQDDENYMKDFLLECCDLDKDFSDPVADLYAIFKEWYEEIYNKRFTPSINKFGRMLVACGFYKEKDARGARVYAGLKLKEEHRYKLESSNRPENV